MKRASTIFLLLLCYTALFAEIVKIDDLYYSLSTATATIAKAQNSDTYTALTKLVLPATVNYNDNVYQVTGIADNAFAKCNKLDTVVWNIVRCTSKTAYNTTPFYDATVKPTVKKFIIGDNVEYIPSFMCYEMSQLDTVILPSSVTQVGTSAFAYCSGLKKVVLPDGLPYTGTSAFRSCTSLESIDLPTSMYTINTNMFAGCTSLKDITLHEGIQSIGAQAFENCALTSVTLPTTLTQLYSAPFQNCSKLDSIVWNATNTSCESATNTWPFYKCTAVKTITFGENVTAIPPYACYGFSGLKRVYNYALNPQTIQSNVFQNLTKANCTLYVPIEYIDLYQKANVWKEFNPIVGIAVDMQYKAQTVAISYLQSDNSLYHMDAQTWQVPVAPRIEGFTFLHWEVQSGNLADGIVLQAVYQANEATAAPADIIINPTNQAQKLIRSGNVYILQDNKVYTLTGVRVE